MKIKKATTSYNNIVCFILIASLITIGVLFVKPQVGIADQGDFDRIMGISGLDLLDSDVNNPKFIRFYDYTVTEYKIINVDDTIKAFTRCSLSYLIILINNICKALGQNIFKTQYLAITYSIIYILAFGIILKSLNIKSKINYIVIAIFILLIFFDGNYLIWFNSLYGEPMMITTLLLFIAFALNYINYRYVLKKNKYVTLQLLFLFFSAFLFLGSKLQVFTAMPIVIFFLLNLLLDNTYSIHKVNLIALCIITYIVIIYPIRINLNSNNLSKDTQFNSVFYGVLNDSENPEQDLLSLGLNPDMAVESKKHAYLDSNEYVKYIPGSKITTEEFYNKISNSKLAMFYFTHPIRLLNGMKYTASKAFYTSTSLGKYSQNYSETPITSFNKFTSWSFIRERMLPKNIYFIILVYIIVIICSIHKYIQYNSTLGIKNKISLLWTVMLIGAVQFPMPFVGNGKADTAKQLFLFNFIFDGLLIIIFSYLLFRALDLIKIKLSKYTLQ